MHCVQPRTLSDSRRRPIRYELPPRRHLALGAEVLGLLREEARDLRAAALRRAQERRAALRPEEGSRGGLSKSAGSKVTGTVTSDGVTRF